MGAAEQMFKSSRSYFDSAEYLAHLAVESLVKSWLLQVANQFPGSHKLTELHEELVRSFGAPPLSTDQARTLSLLDRYAELRYPNRNDPTEEGTEHLSYIQSLMQGIYEKLPDELLLELSRVDVLKKGGRVLMKKKIKGA